MAREYRSRSRILLELLRAMNHEPHSGVSALLSKANLSTTRFDDYMAELVDRGLVLVRAHARRTFELSPDGQRLLAEMDRLERFMADFGMEL